MRTTTTKGSKTTEQFLAAMKRHGFPTQAYAGRFFWRGPAASVPRDQLQEAMSATRVKLQRDNLGLDWIVYPVQGDPDWYAANRDYDSSPDGE